LRSCLCFNLFCCRCEMEASTASRRFLPPPPAGTTWQGSPRNRTWQGSPRNRMSAAKRQDFIDYLLRFCLCTAFPHPIPKEFWCTNVGIAPSCQLQIRHCCNFSAPSWGMHAKLKFPHSKLDGVRECLQCLNNCFLKSSAARLSRLNLPQLRSHSELLLWPCFSAAVPQLPTPSLLLLPPSLPLADELSWQHLSAPQHSTVSHHPNHPAAKLESFD